MARLTMILGPMKSGKSFDMISRFSPLKHSCIPYALYKPEKDARDAGVWSRSGGRLDATDIRRLEDITPVHNGIVGIDEIHMFDDGVNRIRRLLDLGTDVVVCGLDMDSHGNLFPIIEELMEVPPDEIFYRKSVCENCNRLNGTHTLVLSLSGMVLSGLPRCVPDDGTHIYKTVCRSCRSLLLGD